MITYVPKTHSIKKIILVGDYPPRQCGIATFNGDLYLNLRLLLPNADITVCTINESSEKFNYSPEVTIEIDKENPESYIEAAKLINQHADDTIVIVQFEYGIYGGKFGSFLADFLETLKCPIVTTLHTILDNPQPDMRAVTERIIESSNRIITLTSPSLDVFVNTYPSASDKIITIAHGIHPVPYRLSSELKPQFSLDGRAVMLTFGLLSRNKGIEHIIAALPKIIKKVPNLMYVIVGATHPEVIRQEGQSYRQELKEQVRKLSTEDHVQFVDGFLPVEDILKYLQAADIYIATSTDPRQAVSGTLSYALGTGRPVISTRFAQAKEIVSQKVGRIVPIADPDALSSAAIELFTDHSLLESMGREAYADTRSMLWSNVADDYIRCLGEVAGSDSKDICYYPDFKWNHLDDMSDGFGMLQFANNSTPDPASGYTLDDNSRALQLVSHAYESGLMPAQKCLELSNQYFQIIDICLAQKPTANYLSATTKLPTNQNQKENLHDSMARSFYALQTAAHAKLPMLRTNAKRILSLLPIDLANTDYIHSSAQKLLGATIALDHGDKSMQPLVDQLADSLVGSYKANSKNDWHWFDATMTYASGQLSASLIEAGRVTGNKTFSKIGLDSLEYLSSRCFMGCVYVPIGQDGWCTADGTRALFDQQAEDPFSMLQALESAYDLTGDKKYIKRAHKVFSWFMGNNLVGLRLYDDLDGGCKDGLKLQTTNKNEGAESTLSYLGARLIIERLRIKNSL